MKARLGMKEAKSRLRERLSAIFLKSGRIPKRRRRRRRAGPLGFTLIEGNITWIVGEMKGK